MPVGVEGVIEHVGTQVGDPVRNSRVFQDGLVDRPLVEMATELAWSCEAVCVEVPLSDSEHIHKDQEAYSSHGLNPPGIADMRIGGIGFRSVFRLAVGPEDQSEGKEDQHHGPEGVADEEISPVGL